MKSRHIGFVLLWMSGSLASFTAIALCVRVLARTLSVFELLAFRNLGGIAILAAAALVHRPFRSRLGLPHPALQATRNLFHFGSQWAWAYGVTVLPLATVFALEFTAPIWLAGLAVVALGERLTQTRLAAIAMGLAGVLIILRPGAASLQPAALIVLGAGLGFAAVAVTTKALTRDVPTFTILFWMNVMQVVPNLVAAEPFFWTKIEPAQSVAAVVLAISGLTSHLCLTQAYRHGDAIVVMPLDFLRIPLAALIGWRFYGEAIDPFVFAGAALIITGLVWNLRTEARREISASRKPGSAPAS